MASSAGTLSLCARGGWEADVCAGNLNLSRLRPCPPGRPAHLHLCHLDEGAQRGLHVCLLLGGQQAEALQQLQLRLAPGRVRVELPQQLLSGSHAQLLRLLPAGATGGIGGA